MSDMPTKCTATVALIGTTVAACSMNCAGATAYEGCRTDADCAGGGSCLAVSANELGDASTSSLFGICF